MGVIKRGNKHFIQSKVKAMQNQGRSSSRARVRARLVRRPSPWYLTPAGSARGILKMAKKRKVSLSVGRGEKLSVARGGGLTAKGRRKYNKASGSHLRAPAPHPRTKTDTARRKSFCSRSRKWTGPRGKAARRRWNC